MATGGSLVAGVARWNSSLPHILTEQETESWQEMWPGYRRHFPKVTQPSKIAKATGWRPSKFTQALRKTFHFQTTTPLQLFFVGFSLLQNLFA